MSDVTLEDLQKVSERISKLNDTVKENKRLQDILDEYATSESKRLSGEIGDLKKAIKDLEKSVKELEKKKK
ncbi:MAG: hypothetical protein AB7Q97_17860 [Gammaproteobacteria bacterium]